MQELWRQIGEEEKEGKAFMTIFGVNLIVWAYVCMLPVFFYAGMHTQKINERTKRLFLKSAQLRHVLREKTAKSHELRTVPRHELPPAYREENWQRNIYGEPSSENYILASTGCELTDAIYAAAHRANIDIVQFENEMRSRDS